MRPKLNLKDKGQMTKPNKYIDTFKSNLPWCRIVSPLLQTIQNNKFNLQFLSVRQFKKKHFALEHDVHTTSVMFGSLTANSFPRHSITLLTLNQSRCRVMKQEIVRKRNESISTIIIFICSSLERLARQRQQQMNVLPIFFCHLLEDLRRFLFFICLV